MFWIGLIVGSILGVVFVGILAAGVSNKYESSLKSKDEEIQGWVNQCELNRKWVDELYKRNRNLEEKIVKGKEPYKIKAGRIPRGIISDSINGS